MKSTAIEDVVGVRAIEVRLPQARMTIDEMALRAGVPPAVLMKRIGVREKPVLGARESLWELARTAAAAALARAGVDPDELDLIIFGSSGVWDRYLWSPAAHIQKHLDARRAFSFDVLQGCNAASLGLKLCTEWLRGRPQARTALLVVADALSGIVDYQNPYHECLFNFADGASAAVLVKGETQNRLVGFAACTNAEYADSMDIRWGHTRLYMNPDPEEDRRLTAEYRVRYLAMIDAALAEADRSRTDISFLCINQGDHRLIRFLEEQLAVPTERISRSHEHLGHLGGSDVLVGWQSYREKRLTRPGDLIVLASSAIGFSWGAAAILA